MNNNVIQVPPSVSRQYLIEGTQGYLLIDTGLSNNYTHLINFMHKSKISLTDIELVVITHADGDHYGCLSLLQRQSFAFVTAASQIEAAAIQKGVSSRELKPKGAAKFFFPLIKPLFKVSPSRIDRILTIGEEFPYLGRLEILDTPGHTPGHISLWSESTRTLFCGDSIRIHGSLLPPSKGSNTWDEEKACVSFEKQLAKAASVQASLTVDTSLDVRDLHVLGIDDNATNRKILARLYHL